MILRTAIALAFALGLATFLQAQSDPCLTWNNLSPAEQESARQTHSLYRDLVKAKKFEEAFPLWEKIYKLAPAADGKRPLHYSDGRDIYLAKYNAETDEAKKEQYAQMVMMLFDQHRKCYPEDAASLYSPQVYYMFYVLQRPDEEMYPILLEAMSKNGNKTDFRILAPLGYVVTRQFANKKIDQIEARRVIEQGRAIATANASGPQAADYKEAQQAADEVIASIEQEVFDCAYFKAKYEPEYRADPDNPDVYEDVLRRLLRAGCDREDALVSEINAKDRARRQAEYEANNPMSVARNLYDAGDVDGALAKYEEIATAADGQLKSSIYLQMASIYRVDKNSVSRARDYARKAAAARPGWGKPYIMIGDMYAASSRACSTDPFQQRVVILAALDEYARAKADPESAGTAQGRINKYSDSTPTAAMMHERGIKAGETRSTGCWIGETVTLR